MPRCWIGLGGNQGDVPGVIRETVRRLLQHPRAANVACSPLYRTAPMGAAAGAPFWNAVARCETDLPPLELLHQLQAWENDFGRVRTMRWGPRTLDLDLLFYGDLILNEPQLTVPHPGAWYRRFVLDPLVTVAPNLLHPVWKQTATQLRDRLCQRPASLVLWSESPALLEPLREALTNRLRDVAISLSDGAQPTASGLMAAISAAPPAAWRTTPHLRFDPQLPHNVLIQALVDAAGAAFEEPQLVREL